MTERKTAEIKIRVTPTFKATLQAAAEAADESMSEFIEKAVEAYLWARKGGELTIKPESFPAGRENVFAAPFTGTPTPVEELLDNDDYEVALSDFKASPVDVLETSDIPVRDEEHPASASCPHGPQPWQFCAACYERSVTR